MAKKRKSLVAEAPQETEPVQSDEPEPEQTQEIVKEDPVVEDEVAGDVEEEAAEEEEEEDEEEEEVEEEEEEEGEEEEEEEEEAEEDLDNMKEIKDDAVQVESVKNEQKSEISENAVPESGGEDEGPVEEEPLEKLLEPFSKEQLTLLIKEAVAKYPDIVDNVHQLADADPSHRKIFVHGLGWEASAESITSVFAKYGEIEDCKVVKDKNSGKSKGYGFILFKHRDGARRALKQPQKTIEGRMTSSQLASAGPVRTPPPSAVAAVSEPPASEYTQRKIYVSNVSAELDTKKLLDFFAKFGEIEEGPLGLDKQTGKPRGFCLFVYKSVKSAKKALEEPHKNFEGHILHCQKAVDGPKHTKGYFNQQQSQPLQQQQRHQEGNQGYYHHIAKKGRYSGTSEGVGHTGGHLMAPSIGSAMPSMGFNQAVPPAAIGQAVAALLASQGAGFGIDNFLGGIGAGANPQGVPRMMNNASYGNQAGMQGGFGGQPQMGRGGVRPHQGGAPYRGRGR